MTSLNITNLATSSYHAIDDVADLHDYVTILELYDAIEGCQKLKAQSYLCADISEGQKICDLGCGFGLETLRLANRVGEQGQVVGLDRSRRFIELARARIPEGIHNLEYVCAGTERLTFADNTFDVTRAERLLPFVAKPAQVIEEMVRVTKPGGYIFSIEADAETFAVNTEDRALTRRILNHKCDKEVRHPWVGRYLQQYYFDCQLAVLPPKAEVIFIHPKITLASFGIAAKHALDDDVISLSEYDAWIEELTELARQDRLHCTITNYLLVGKKQ